MEIYKYLLRDSKVPAHAKRIKRYFIRGCKDFVEDWNWDKTKEEDDNYMDLDCAIAMHEIDEYFCFKVIEYRTAGIGKTPTGNEWYDVLHYSKIPDDDLIYHREGDYFTPKKEFTVMEEL